MPAVRGTSPPSAPGGRAGGPTAGRARRASKRFVGARRRWTNGQSRHSPARAAASEILARTPLCFELGIEAFAKRVSSWVRTVVGDDVAIFGDLLGWSVALSGGAGGRLVVDAEVLSDGRRRREKAPHGLEDAHKVALHPVLDFVPGPPCLRRTRRREADWRSDTSLPPCVSSQAPRGARCRSAWAPGSSRDPSALSRELRVSCAGLSRRREGAPSRQGRRVW